MIRLIDLKLTGTWAVWSILPLTPVFCILCLVASIMASGTALAAPRHGIAMHGEPGLPSDFQHFSYTDPGAKKGGTLVRAVHGSFDSLNPLIVQGISAFGIRGLVYESLMARALDEPFSLYGHVAETIETPDDRSWVIFTIDKEARFSDGVPITADDVIFSRALLQEKGRPNHRSYYSKVIKTEKIGERGVKFTFRPDGDREMPLIMGLMPILPRHAIDPETFGKSSLKPPIGSGPYIVEAVDPGKVITYRRNLNYWAKDRPAMRGRHNFDLLRFDYYRDRNAMFEAFKKGLFDLQSEGDPGRWATTYDFPSIRDGRVTKSSFKVGLPSGMSALVFNTRRPIFADTRVRQALIYLFDFEWMNKVLYHNLYARTQSYFDRSELSSHGRGADATERALLAPYLSDVAAPVLAGTHKFPQTDGSGRNRANLRRALKLLFEAGFKLDSGQLVNAKTGAPFAFEILSATRSQERLLLSYARTLRRAGITATIRQVDSALYQRRKKTFDFDMIQSTWWASLSPGNEQSFRWSAETADAEGSYNFAGVKKTAVDAMIQAILEARTRTKFVSAVRALDRVLLSGNYVVPLFHLPEQWVAIKSQLKYPSKTSLYGFQPDTWWWE